jgi:hypothetical protein
MKTAHINAIVVYGMDGKEKDVIELTDEEVNALERAMQWPEDLAKWDRINRVINGYEMGSPI